MTGQSLSVRGFAFGHYPQHIDAGDAPALEAAWRALRSRFTRPQAAGLPRRVQRALESTRARLSTCDPADFEREIDRVRAGPRRRASGAAPRQPAPRWRWPAP